MELSENAKNILRSILSLGTSEDAAASTSERCESPGASALFALCELLAKAPKEEELQVFLSQHPGFLMGLFGTKDAGDLALVAKPRIGSRYIADFGILQVFQGGATIFLIEIETSHEPLFNQQLGPARRLQSAITQVEEWREWINPNKLTFSRDMIHQAKQCDLYEKSKSSLKGYRFCDPQTLDGLWANFGGYTDPNIHYAIVVGRWSQLSGEERVRLMSKFRSTTDLDVITFEQLARQANYRPDRPEF